jgi:sodium/hydrogen antiporter
LPYMIPSTTLWWFVPALFMVLRPLAVLVGTFREPVSGAQQAMVCWFGIRGIGSVFYLMFALTHGVTGALAREMITLTLATVTVSILIHGVSVSPLMKWYLRSKALVS